MGYRTQSILCRAARQAATCSSNATISGCGVGGDGTSSMPATALSWTCFPRRYVCSLPRRVPNSSRNVPITRWSAPTMFLAPLTASANRPRALLTPLASALPSLAAQPSWMRPSLKRSIRSTSSLMFGKTGRMEIPSSFRVWRPRPGSRRRGRPRRAGRAPRDCRSGEVRPATCGRIGEARPSADGNHPKAYGNRRCQPG